MSQSRGPVQSVLNASLSSQEVLAVQDHDDVYMAAPFEDMSKFVMPPQFAIRSEYDARSPSEKDQARRADGYYGWKSDPGTKSPAQIRLLGKDNDARIRAMEKVADRYIRRSKRQDHNGPTAGDEPGIRSQMEWGSLRPTVGK